MQAILQKKHEQGSAVAELLKDGWNHHGSESHGIFRDYEECDLEGQSHADETVIERGVGDGRRIVAADHIEDEIKRCEDQHTPNARDPKYDLGEFHVPALVSATCARGTAEAAVPTWFCLLSPGFLLSAYG